MMRIPLNKAHISLFEVSAVDSVEALVPFFLLGGFLLFYLGLVELSRLEVFQPYLVAFPDLLQPLHSFGLVLFLFFV